MSLSKLTIDPNVTVPIVLRLSILQHLTEMAATQGLSRSALVRRAVLSLVTDDRSTIGASSAELQR